MSARVAVRAAEPADVAAITDLVAEDDGALVGLLVLQPAGDHLLIENVAVRPATQGRGIGRQLMGLAEAQALARGLPEIRLYTNAAMTEDLNYSL